MEQEKNTTTTDDSPMEHAEEKTESNEEDILEFYVGYSWKQSFIGFFLFLIPVVLVWKIFGTPSNKFMVIYPREFISLPATLLSNFSHGSLDHLVGNMATFFFLGLWVMKTEGTRGILGICVGMTFAGLIIWLFGENPSLGFSSAVFACIGILIVRSMRESFRQTFFLVIILGTIFQTSETIRPTQYVAGKNISWLGHLGGLIGGMLTQIRSRRIALQILFKNQVITLEEFTTIAKRIHHGETVSQDNGENVSENGEEEIPKNNEENISKSRESEPDNTTKETSP